MNIVLCKININDAKLKTKPIIIEHSVQLNTNCKVSHIVNNKEIKIIILLLVINPNYSKTNPFEDLLQNI